MHTTIDEIAPELFRISTFIPEVAAPAGFTFNQFLVRDEQPFLYHTGMRQLFPVVRDAVASLIDIERLRWIGFAHVEADECGAMNHFLAAAPHAQVVHGELACALSLNDMADRPPRALADGEVVETGARRLRFLPTPHVPHNWESGLFFEETTRTVLAGDILGTIGSGPAVTDDGEIVEQAVESEHAFHSTSLGPLVPSTLRALADLRPARVAVMHGASFDGDAPTTLRRMADVYADMVRALLEQR